MTTETQQALTKILFWLEPEEWHGHATETLWAEHIEGNHFRLRNVPFHAFGVSAEDIVSVRSTSEGLEFNSVVLRGGHSTYRILINAKTTEEQVDQYWAPLQALGCTYEQGERNLRAIDVPRNADIGEVYALLKKGEDDGIWGFEEGHCGHPLES